MWKRRKWESSWLLETGEVTAYGKMVTDISSNSDVGSDSRMGWKEFEPWLLRSQLEGGLAWKDEHDLGRRLPEETETLWEDAVAWCAPWWYHNYRHQDKLFKEAHLNLLSRLSAALLNTFPFCTMNNCEKNIKFIRSEKIGDCLLK